MNGREVITDRECNSRQSRWHCSATLRLVKHKLATRQQGWYLFIVATAVNIQHSPRSHYRTRSQRKWFACHLCPGVSIASHIEINSWKYNHKTEFIFHYLSLVVGSLFIRYGGSLRATQAKILHVPAEGQSLVVVMDCNPSPETNQRPATHQCSLQCNNNQIKNITCYFEEKSSPQLRKSFRKCAAAGRSETARSTPLEPPACHLCPKYSQRDNIWER